MFSSSAHSRQLWPLTDVGPRIRAESILRRCRHLYPEIGFDVLWRSESVNAQAYRLGARRYVRIYGGLARHRALGPEGLALAIAHEVGHHQAGPPFKSQSAWMSSEERADQWARQTGFPRICGGRRVRGLLAVALGQLSEIAHGLP